MEKGWENTSHLNYSSHRRTDNQKSDKTGIFPLTLVSWVYVLQSVSQQEEREEDLHKTHQAVHSSRPCCEERHGDWEDLHTGLSSPSWTISQTSVLLYAQTVYIPALPLGEPHLKILLLWRKTLLGFSTLFAASTYWKVWEAPPQLTGKMLHLLLVRTYTTYPYTTYLYNIPILFTKIGLCS